MLSFGLVVAANNVLALKSFSVFLNNYCIFEKPLFVEKWLINKAQIWVGKKAIRNFLDIVAEVQKTEINIGLNDCTTGMFTVLYIANEFKHGRMLLNGATELFHVLSHTELEFEKLKKPKSDESYT